MRNVRHRRIAALGVIVVPLFALLLSSGPASAANTTPTNTTGTQTGLICGTTASSATAADNDLPINRWSGSLGDEHERLPGGFLSGISNAPSSIDRSVFVGGMTSIGASEWQLAASATEGASQFCFANTVGEMANTFAGKLGTGITTSPLLGVLAVLALITLAWRALRGRGNFFRQIIKFMVVVAILFTIVGAAMASTATDDVPFSPAWIIQTGYNAISEVASGPANAISNVANATIGGSTQETIAKSDPLSCYWYSQELVDEYQKAYTATGSYGYVVPTSLNSLWEQAAIPTYEDEQFGASNNYAPLMYCHLLEDNAGIQPASQLAVAKASGSLSGDSNLNSFGVTQASALAWNGALTNDQEDESMVAWAACQSPGTGSGGSGFTPSEWNISTGKLTTAAFTTVPSPTTSGTSTVNGADCQTFWSANAPANGGQYGDASGPFASPSAAPWPGQILNPDMGVFNWGDSESAIATSTNSSAAGTGIANFIGNLHGTQNSGAEASAFFFLLSSTVILVVFGVLALALIIAKLSLIILMILLPLMLIFALMPTMEGRFSAYVKHLFGLILFSTCAGLILSFVAIITAVLAAMGTQATGAGSLFSQIFITISPVAALYLVRLFITKVLKAPSPFSMKGAAAFAGAMGGFGSAAVGVDVLDHMKRRGGQAVGAARGRMSGQKTKSGPSQGKDSMGGNGAKASATPAGPGVGAATPVDPKSPGSTDGARPVAEGAATGAGSMFAKVRRPKLRDDEQHQANQHARAERISERTKRVEQMSNSVLHPRTTKADRGEPESTRMARIKESVARSRKRFNQREGEGLKTHRLKGSVLTAAAAGARVKATVKKAPRVLKYGAVGVGAAGLLGFGAPVAAGAGLVYGAHKLRNHMKDAPLRAQKNLQDYRAFKADEEVRNKKATADEESMRASEAAAKQEDAERAAKHRFEMSQAERDAHDEAARRLDIQQRRIEAFKRGEPLPIGDR
jgi:hypothetical protein